MHNFSLVLEIIIRWTIELLLLNFIVRKQRAVVSIWGWIWFAKGWIWIANRTHEIVDRWTIKSSTRKRGGDLTFSSITIVTIRFPICKFGENNHCLYLHAIVCLQIPINQYSWRQFQSCFRLTLAINYSAGNYEANPQSL